MPPLPADEESQLLQTIEMFEVITQSQPHDYESLDILKEAYVKLNREKDVVRTSKRIAEAYVQLGQLSSAILEYESILQRFPEDRDVLNALAEIESKANSFAAPRALADPEPADARAGIVSKFRPADGKATPGDIDDGRQAMQKLLVDGKHISLNDFELFWDTPNLNDPPSSPVEPFIQTLSDKQILPLDRSLKLLLEKTRLGYLPLDKYDVDVEWARSFPRDICLRWSILPFDRMSKSIFVATANPFNKQAARDLEKLDKVMKDKYRVLWYISSPTDLTKILKKIFR